MWFDRSVGFYGWNDTTFPVWVDQLALIPALLLLALAARGLTLARARAATRACPSSASTRSSALGLLLVIGADSYLVPQRRRHLLRTALPAAPAGPPRRRARHRASAAQAGAGDRWLGALVVVLFLGHDVFSQLQVISRFYG